MVKRENKTGYRICWTSVFWFFCFEHPSLWGTLQKSPHLHSSMLCGITWAISVQVALVQWPLGACRMDLFGCDHCQFWKWHFLCRIKTPNYLSSMFWKACMYDKHAFEDSEQTQSSLNQALCYIDSSGNCMVNSPDEHSWDWKPVNCGWIMWPVLT